MAFPNFSECFSVRGDPVLLKKFFLTKHYSANMEVMRKAFPRFRWSLLFTVILPALILTSCESELIRKQEAEIQKLQKEITRQSEEIEELKLARLKMRQKRQDCNRAFRDFEKAQKLKDPERAIALYRGGLRLCPDDDVAHYELGKILVTIGQTKEAEEEFETALQINPDFQSARRELKALKEKQ